jgi:UDP:flavonoid glycosyltransferase YjiC (YdhE family)
MRIALLTLGSQGDVRPFVALGLGLQAAGHEVSLVTHGAFEPLIRRRGLSCSAVGDDPGDFLENDLGRMWLNTGGNALLFFRQFSHIAQALIQQYMIDCWNACQGAEAMVFSTIGLAVGHAIAEKLAVPFGMAAPYPLTPTRAFSSPYFPAAPAWLPCRDYYNRLTHVASIQLFWQLLRPAVNKARREVLHLPPLAPNWPLREMHAGHLPLLYCYSPSIVPAASDWNNCNHVTGCWFLDREAEWQPPRELVDFLKAGPAPVYVGFGSMYSSNPQEMTEMVLHALARAKQRGILQTGWGGLSNADLPDDVFAVDSIPHDWLFPQMAAVVHHGGSGTTAAGLRAGVPTVIIPFFADQPFWGARVFELGAGPAPIPKKRLTLERLTNAIRVATCDEVIRGRASALGERIRAEDGVTQAVEVLQRYLHISSIGGD